MRLKWFTAFIIGFIFQALEIKAQKHEKNGWLFILHKQKLAKRINLLTDVQVRSADNLDYVATLLLRSAASYQFNKHHAGALGYAYVADWKEENERKVYQDENRIFEQYLLEFKTNKIEWTGRFRLEQRFTGQKHDRNFSQRTRAFVSALIPLIRRVEFNKGPYCLLQNEFFLNVQHKEKTNGHSFDQNRLYGGLGYKHSKKLKTELGYMYRRKQNLLSYNNNHIVQVMISSSL